MPSCESCTLQTVGVRKDVPKNKILVPNPIRIVASTEDSTRKGVDQFSYNYRMVEGIPDCEALDLSFYIELHILSLILESKISPPKDAETPVESPIPISPSSSVGSSSPFRSTTPPPDYPFDKSILDNSLWIIPQPLGSEPVPEKPNESDAC
ncbi:hypothetical protein Tco_0989909 [Tanacetum coccineum]|uniref:Uncharacterized protein n=1 Tax=Tanacetum coccineum TaxID=301880 RepID=A0ABQ5EW32_9ASTR